MVKPSVHTSFGVYEQFRMVLFFTLAKWVILFLKKTGMEDNRLCSNQAWNLWEDMLSDMNRRGYASKWDEEREGRKREK